MSLAGTGAVAIWHDLLPDATEDFYEWHNREHMPERVGIPAANRARAIEALVGRILSPLSLRNGISGAHLCLADEAISNIETSEKNARADTTLVPTWIGLLEGNSVSDVRAAGHALVS